MRFNVDKLLYSFSLKKATMIVKNWIILGVAVAAILAYTIGIRLRLVQSIPRVPFIVAQKIIVEIPRPVMLTNYLQVTKNS